MRITIAFVLGLLSFALFMFLGETMGAYAFILMAVYFFLCQYLLSRGKQDAYRRDWPIMLALDATVLVMVFNMVLVEKRDVILSQGPGMLLSACGGTYAGAVVASLTTRRKAGRITLLVAAAIAAALVVYAISANGPRPIAQDRLAFVGVWSAGPAFEIEIRQDGTARINQDRNIGGTAWEQLAIKVAPDFIETARVRFEGRQMIVVRPSYYARSYTIDKSPFLDGGRQKIVLNGVELVRK
jgi:hypothetical protein